MHDRSSQLAIPVTSAGNPRGDASRNARWSKATGPYAPGWRRLARICSFGALAEGSCMAEVALYAPVKAFLERLGFTVKGEVRGADLVAVRQGEQPLVVIAELKLAFSLDLLLQAADRMAMADEVWLAVAATRRGRDRDRRAHRLCRLVGLGLLAVNVGRSSVEILVEPAPYRPRGNPRKRGLLLQEFARRRGDPMTGGGSRRPVMTAYRQQALACAAAMRDGPRRVRELRADMPDAQKILRRNVYGWFTRVARGLYALAPAGEEALLRWPDGGSGDGVSSADGRSLARDQHVL